jgi:hypothetical protein
MTKRKNGNGESVRETENEEICFKERKYRAAVKTPHIPSVRFICARFRSWYSLLFVQPTNQLPSSQSGFLPYDSRKEKRLWCASLGCCMQGKRKEKKRRERKGKEQRHRWSKVLPKKE